MPKSDRYRANKLKQEILKGKSGKQALLDAGYSPNSASHPTQVKILQNVYNCIEQEFKLSDITPEVVIARVNLISNDPNASNTDKLRANELLGKFLAIWKDKSEITTHNSINPSELSPEKIRSRVANILQTIDNKEVKT